MRKLSLALMLLAASVAAHAATSAQKCKYSRIAELPVWIQNGKPVTEGSINGHKVGILLDTGAGPSIVHRSTVQKLGLTPVDVTGLRMFGTGGETAARAVQIDEFKFGNAARKEWRVLVSGEGTLGSNIAVVLGYDFLQNLDVEFDLPGGAVRFFQAEDCGNVALSYWTREPTGQLELHPGLDRDLAGRRARSSTPARAPR